MKLYKDKPMDPPAPTQCSFDPPPRKKIERGGGGFAPWVLFSTTLKNIK